MAHSRSSKQREILTDVELVKELPVIVGVDEAPEEVDGCDVDDGDGEVEGVCEDEPDDVAEGETVPVGVTLGVCVTKGDGCSHSAEVGGRDTPRKICPADAEPITLEMPDVTT